MAMNGAWTKTPTRGGAERGRLKRRARVSLLKCLLALSLISFLVANGAQSVSAKGGRLKDEFRDVDPSNTYSCDCTCDESYHVYPFGKGTDYVNNDKVRTCAPSMDLAKTYCASACKQYLEDFFKNQWYAYTTVDQCTVTNVHLQTQGTCNPKVSSSQSRLLSARPHYATFDGPVDFGQTYVQVYTVSNDDFARTKLDGTISIDGGNCPGQECPISVTAISLSSYPESFTTSRGRQVENLIVQNEGVWSGVKKADDTFQLSPDSLVSISATFDGKRGIITKKPSGYINGSIKYGYGRLTTDSGILGTNAMLIDGMFADDMTEIKLHLHLWLANCQPTVEAYVRCMPGIEQPSPNYLQLGSKFGLLGNLEGADLCNAITADKPSRCVTLAAN